MSRMTVGKSKKKKKEGGPLPQDVLTERPSFRAGELKLTILVRGYEMDELERCAGTELGRELVKEILRVTLSNHTVTIADGVWRRYPRLGQLMAEIRMENER